MISSTIKTYLKTYLKRKEDKDKNDEEEKRLKVLKSLNDTTDFLL
jgi:aromatic ring hydroxylase